MMQASIYLANGVWNSKRKKRLIISIREKVPTCNSKLISNL